MDGTTMDAAGQTGARENSGPGGPKSELGRRATEALRNVWWFTLGGVVVAGEKTEKLAKFLASRGKQAEPSVSKPLRKAEDAVGSALKDMGTELRGVGRKFGRSAEAVQDALDDRISAAIERAATPLIAEVRELSSKVDALSEHVENLRANKDKPPQFGA